VSDAVAIVGGRRYADGDERAVGSALAFLPDTALTSGVDWDLRFKTRYSLDGVWARQPDQRRARGRRAPAENSRHYFQRPDLTSAALDVTARRSAGRGMSRSAKSRQVRALQTNVSFKTPASINDVGSWPRRSAERQQLLQIRSEDRRLVPQAEINFNHMPRGISTATASSAAATSTAITRSSTTGASAAASTFRRSGSTTVRPARARNVLGGLHDGWYYIESDNRPERLAELLQWCGRNGKVDVVDVSPSITYRPLPAVSSNPGVRLSKTCSIPMGGQSHRRSIIVLQPSGPVDLRHDRR